jgi:hemolysin activation/secretion protein
VSKTLTLIVVGTGIGLVSLALYLFVPRPKEQVVLTPPSLASNEPVQKPSEIVSKHFSSEKNHPSQNLDKPTQALPISGKVAPQPVDKTFIETPAVAQQLGAEVVKSDQLILKEIKFKGVKSFSNESMQALVARFVGVPLNFEDLPDIAVSVENFYKQNNYVARVLLSQQDLAHGWLTLEVMESSLSQEQVEKQLSEISTQHDSEFGKKTELKQSGHATKDLNTGAPEFESRQIADAQPQDDTNLILKIYKDHSRQSELTLDNEGESKYGHKRVAGQFSLFNTWLPNDRLSLSALISEGSEFFKSNYNFQFGRTGWNMGLTFTAMDYKVIAGYPADLGELGKAFTQALNVNFPLSTTFNTESDLKLSAQASQITNVSSAGYSLSAYETEVLVAEFSGIDRAFANTSNTLSYNIQWSMGQTQLSTRSDSAYSDQGGSSTEGQFNKVRAHLTFIEPWTPTTDLYVGITSQLADKNLAFYEKLQMGGSLGIRAYGLGTGMASNGQMLNLEIRHQLQNGLALTGFYDWGHVTEMVNPDPTGSVHSPNSYELKGYGLSANYNFGNGASVRATWARRDGTDPKSADPTTDHPTDRNRYWLQVTIPF